MKKENQLPKNVYEFVTNRISRQLEKGIVPWQRPWEQAGLPKNLITGRPYRGINVWLLVPLNYAQNYFLTFKQVKDMGAWVKEGEKANLVVYWKWVDVKDEESDETAKVPFLRYQAVLNIAQCEGIPDAHLPAMEEKKDSLKECEAIIGNMLKKPEIKHKENKAFYNPLVDFVNMPKISSFKDNQSYYGRLFQELVHSTGHPSRVNRKEVMQQTAFGADQYSTEELAAEMGACYLKSFAGMSKENFETNDSNIKAWLEKMRNDKRFIVYISTMAQKATDFILNVTFEIKENVPAADVKLEEIPEGAEDDLPF